MTAFDEGELTHSLSPIFRKYHIQIAILYSPPARDKIARRHDLDLILVRKTANDFFDRYQGVLQEIDTLIKQRDIDIFIYTTQELRDISHQPFIAKVLDEGKVVYES